MTLDSEINLMELSPFTAFTAFTAGELVSCRIATFKYQAIKLENRSTAQ